jgi:hypothetical protein
MNSFQQEIPMTEPTIETVHDTELQKAPDAAKADVQPAVETTTEKNDPIDPLGAGSGFIPGEGI